MISPILLVNLSKSFTHETVNSFHRFTGDELPTLPTTRLKGFCVTCSGCRIRVTQPSKSSKSLFLALPCLPLLSAFAPSTVEVISHSFRHGKVEAKTVCLWSSPCSHMDEFRIDKGEKEWDGSIVQSNQLTGSALGPAKYWTNKRIEPLTTTFYYVSTKMSPV